MNYLLIDSSSCCCRCWCPLSVIVCSGWLHSGSRLINLRSWHIYTEGIVCAAHRPSVGSHTYWKHFVYNEDTEEPPGIHWKRENYWMRQLQINSPLAVRRSQLGQESQPITRGQGGWVCSGPRTVSKGWDAFSVLHSIWPWSQWHTHLWIPVECWSAITTMFYREYNWVKIKTSVTYWHTEFL